MKRTHHCAQLTKADLHATVSLAGWVDSVRDHGGIIECESEPRRTVFRILMPKSTDSYSGEVAEPDGVRQSQGDH